MRVFTTGKRHALNGSSDTTPRILTLPFLLQNGELSSALCYPPKHTGTKSASSTKNKARLEN
jgi:hypothetical protein